MRRFVLFALVLAFGACDGVVPFSGGSDAATSAQQETPAPDSLPASAVDSASAGAAAALDSIPADTLAALLTELRALRSEVETLRAAPAADSASLTDSGIFEGVRFLGLRVVFALLTLVVAWAGIRGLSYVLETLAERMDARRLLVKRMVPVVRVVAWAFVFYVVFRFVLGLHADALLAAGAAAGVAVGFGAQDVVKNIFGGLLVILDQPFQVGDKVSIGGTYGEVTSIGLRSTKIVTPDDNLVTVPNAQIVGTQVANANAGELNCQVVTDLYLPGWVDEGRAKAIARDAVVSSEFIYLKKPVVVLVSDIFEETFLLRVRIKAYVLDPRLEFQFQSDVTERARAAYREAGMLARDRRFDGGREERSPDARERAE